MFRVKAAACLGVLGRRHETYAEMMQAMMTVVIATAVAGLSASPRLGTAGGFLREQGVPTGAEWPSLAASTRTDELRRRAVTVEGVEGTRMVMSIASHSECEAMIAAVEAAGVEQFDAGKNRHGAVQIIADESFDATGGER